MGYKIQSTFQETQDNDFILGIDSNYSLGAVFNGLNQSVDQAMANLKNLLTTIM